MGAANRWHYGDGLVNFPGWFTAGKRFGDFWSWRARTPGGNRAASCGHPGGYQDYYGDLTAEDAFAAAVMGDFYPRVES